MVRVRTVEFPLLISPGVWTGECVCSPVCSSSALVTLSPAAVSAEILWWIWLLMPSSPTGICYAVSGQLLLLCCCKYRCLCAPRGNCGFKQLAVLSPVLMWYFSYISAFVLCFWGSGVCLFICFSARTVMFVICVNIMFILKSEHFDCSYVEIRSCVGELYLKAWLWGNCGYTQTLLELFK